jgi:O-antigen/teichoic acid export membrane protein
MYRSVHIILYPGIAFLLIRQFSLLGASIAYVCLVTMNVFYSARRVHKECLHQSFLAFILQQFKVLLLALMTYGTTFKIIVYYQAKSDIFILAQGYLITSMIFLAIGYFLISEEMKHEIVNLTKKYIHLPTQIGK